MGSGVDVDAIDEGVACEDEAPCWPVPDTMAATGWYLLLEAEGPSRTTEVDVVNCNVAEGRPAGKLNSRAGEIDSRATRINLMLNEHCLGECRERLRDDQRVQSTLVKDEGLVVLEDATLEVGCFLHWAGAPQ
jgi:hypothetical protein